MKEFLDWIAEHWVIWLVSLYFVLYFGVNGFMRTIAILKGEKLTDMERKDKREEP